MKTVHPTLIVGIGGSAGALNAYKDFLGALPHDTGMAFVFISHMNPAAQSHLAMILQRETKMFVTMASNAMTILPNHIYVIPQDSDLTMDEYRFKVLSPRSGRIKQVDIFFISLANEMSSRAVGIILSGYGADGTVGIKHIKANGGITFAQDLSAEIDSMPQQAQDSGFVDFVIPINEIPAKLQSIAAALAT